MSDLSKLKEITNRNINSPFVISRPISSRSLLQPLHLHNNSNDVNSSIYNSRTATFAYEDEERDRNNSNTNEILIRKVNNKVDIDIKNKLNDIYLPSPPNKADIYYLKNNKSIKIRKPRYYNDVNNKNIVNNHENVDSFPMTVPKWIESIPRSYKNTNYENYKKLTSSFELNRNSLTNSLNLNYISQPANIQEKEEPKLIPIEKFNEKERIDIFKTNLENIVKNSDDINVNQYIILRTQYVAQLKATLKSLEDNLNCYQDVLIQLEERTKKLEIRKIYKNEDAEAKIAFSLCVPLIRVMSASQILSHLPDLDIASFHQLIISSNYFNSLIKEASDETFLTAYKNSMNDPSKPIIVDFLNKLHYHSLFLKNNLIDINSLEKKKLLLIDKVKSINEIIFNQIIPQIQLSTTQLVQAVYDWRNKLEDHKRVYLHSQENILYLIQVDMNFIAENYTKLRNIHQICVPGVQNMNIQSKNPLLLELQEFSNFNPSSFDFNSLKTECKIKFSIDPIFIPAYKKSNTILPFYVILASHYYILHEEMYLDSRDGPFRWHSIYCMRSQPKPPDNKSSLSYNALESPRINNFRSLAKKSSTTSLELKLPLPEKSDNSNSLNIPFNSPLPLLSNLSERVNRQNQIKSKIDSAIVIQRAWRKHALIGKDKTTIINYDNNLSEEDAALIIQSNYKKYICRKKYLLHLEEKPYIQAATIISKVYRGYVIRRKLNQAKHQEEQLLIIKNIKVIQAFFHSYLWKKRAKQALESVKNPSLAVSKPSDPSRLQKLLESAEILIARAKNNEAMFKAILIIQTYFRRKRTRIKAREDEAILWKQNFACRILQSNIKGFVTRIKLNKRLKQNIILLVGDIRKIKQRRAAEARFGGLTKPRLKNDKTLNGDYSLASTLVSTKEDVVKSDVYDYFKHVKPVIPIEMISDLLSNPVSTQPKCIDVNFDANNTRRKATFSSIQALLTEEKSNQISPSLINLTSPRNQSVMGQRLSLLDMSSSRNKSIAAFGSSNVRNLTISANHRKSIVMHEESDNKLSIAKPPSSILKTTSIFNSNPDQFLTALPDTAVAAFNSVISAIIDEEAPQIKEDRDSKKRATNKGTFFINKSLQSALKSPNTKTNSIKISNKSPLNLSPMNKNDNSKPSTPFQMNKNDNSKPSTPFQRPKTSLVSAADRPKNRFQLNVLMHQHFILKSILNNLRLHD